MSVQIALLAPATRVASRKLGPVAGQRARPRRRARRRPGRRARWRARAAGARRRPSRGRASRRRSPPGARRGRRAGGAARSSSDAGRGRAVGVRYQVAPSKRSARACSTPAVSAPASGWPPTKRGSSRRGDDRALGRADVGDHAVVRARRVQDGADRLRQRADRRGDDDDLGPVDRLGDATPAARSSAPRRAPPASARASGSQPRTSAPRRSRAASPTEPPISPTPRTASRTPAGARRGRRVRRSGDSCRRPRRPARAGRVGGEVVRAQRLRPVADRLLGLRVDLDDDPVRAGRRRGERERLDEVAPAGRVARVDDHRQVRELLEHRDRRQVEREAVGRLEGADAALAEDHGLVALLEHVLGGHQQLLERARRARA